MQYACAVLIRELLKKARYDVLEAVDASDALAPAVRHTRSSRHADSNC